MKFEAITLVGIEHFSRSMRLNSLDPNTVFVRPGMAHAYFVAASYDEAISLAAKSIALFCFNHAQRL
jgi:hypothetical protein